MIIENVKTIEVTSKKALSELTTSLRLTLDEVKKYQACSLADIYTASKAYTKENKELTKRINFIFLCANHCKANLVTVKQLAEHFNDEVKANEHKMYNKVSSIKSHLNYETANRIDCRKRDLSSIQKIDYLTSENFADLHISF